MAKKLSSNLSKNTVEMTASSRISAAMDSKYPQTSTTSIKVDILTRGLKNDATKSFVQSIMGRTMGNNSGSFSFKVRTETAIQHDDALEKIVVALHKETDFILSEAYNMLTEEEKTKGEKIAEQNVIRNEMVRLLGDAADATTLVDNWLETNNQLYIPDTVQVEATIKGGHRSYVRPQSEQGYKMDVATNEPGSPQVWRRTSEIYGMKRVPLYSDDSMTKAYEGIVDLANMWELHWKGIEIVSDVQVIEEVLKFIGKLKHQSHIIKTRTLSEESIVKAKKVAADNVAKMKGAR